MQFKLLVLFPFLIIEGFNSTFVNITVSDEYRKLTVREKSSSVEFTATVHCFPECKITWYNQLQERIEPRNQSDSKPKWMIMADDEHETYRLKINNVWIEDFGVYQIEAVNSHHKNYENFSLIVEAKPQIHVKVPETPIAAPEANFTLHYECNATGYPTPQIIWSIRNCDDYPDCEEETFHPIPADMFSEETSTSNTPFRVESKLHFKPNQSTVVQCEAKNLLGTAEYSENFYATDYGLGIGVVKLENSETITEGDDVNITCAYSKYFFEKELSWIYNSEQLDKTLSLIPSKDYEIKNWVSTYSRRSTLFMPNVQKNQSGFYECHTKEPVYWLPSFLPYVNFTVLEAVKPTVVYSNMNDGVWETIQGAAIKFIIQVDGIPSPSIHWYKDGNRLSFNDHVILTHGHKNSTTLAILNVSPADDGTYSFVAFNKAGNVSESLKLSIFTVSSPEDSKYTEVLLFFLAVFLGAVLWYSVAQYKEKKKLKEVLRQLGLHVCRNGKMPTLDPEENIENQTIPYDSDKYEFPREKLQFEEVLGSGAFGAVKKAKADGIINKDIATTVAVKLAKSDPEMLFVKYLATELKIMIYLGQHLNVVNLLGACTKDLSKGELAVIVEYCEYGNLRQFLSARRTTFINQITTSDEVDFTIHSADDGDTRNDDQLVKTMDLMSWSLQLAKGMSYIANRRIIHGDLAARNVLLAQGRVIKIGDFGLSKNMRYENEQYRSSKTMLPVRWMAIESIRNRIFSLQSDVWSFGVTIWEIFSLAITPYPGLESLSNLDEILESGYRLEKPEFATRKIYEVMKSCWNTEPTSRPTFAELSKKLGRLFADSAQSLYARSKGTTRSESVCIQEVQNYTDILDLTDEGHSNSTKQSTNRSPNISPQTTNETILEYIEIRNTTKPTPVNNQGRNSSEYSATPNMNIPLHHPLEYIEMTWKRDSNE